MKTVFKMREIDLRIIIRRSLIGRNWIKDDLGLNFKNLILYVEDQRYDFILRIEDLEFLRFIIGR